MKTIFGLIKVAAIYSPYYFALVMLDGIAPWVTSKDIVYVLGAYFLAQMISGAIRDELR